MSFVQEVEVGGAYFDYFNCGGINFCDNPWQWLDSALMCTATVLCVVGLAVTFFLNLTNLTTIFLIVGGISAYHTIVLYTTGADDALAHAAHDLSEVDEDLQDKQKQFSASAEALEKALASQTQSTDGLKGVVGQVRTFLSTAQRQLSETSASLAAANKEKRALSAQNQKLQSQLTVVQKDMQGLQTLVEQSVHQTEQFGRQIGAVSVSVEARAAQMQQVTAGFKSIFSDPAAKKLAATITSAEQMTQQIFAALKGVNGSLDSSVAGLVKADHELDTDHAQLSSQVTQLRSVEQNLKLRTAELDKLQAQLEATRKSLSQVSADVDTKSAAFEQLKTQYFATTQNLQRATVELSVKKQEIIEAEEQLKKALQEAQSKMQTELTSLQKAINEKRAELAALQKNTSPAKSALAAKASS